MKTFSEKYPLVLFIISGEGEESGDLWKAYIRNGMMQRAQATFAFEECDASKMEPM